MAESATANTSAATMQQDGLLLDVKNLRMWFPIQQGVIFQRTVGHVRAVDDESHVVSFGLLEGSAADMDRVREDMASGEDERQSRMADFVESTQLDGIFEVAIALLEDAADAL